MAELERTITRQDPPPGRSRRIRKIDEPPDAERPAVPPPNTDEVPPGVVELRLRVAALQTEVETLTQEREGQATTIAGLKQARQVVENAARQAQAAQAAVEQDSATLRAEKQALVAEQVARAKNIEFLQARNADLEQQVKALADRTRQLEIRERAFADRERAFADREKTQAPGKGREVEIQLAALSEEKAFLRELCLQMAKGRTG